MPKIDLHKFFQRNSKFIIAGVACLVFFYAFSFLMVKGHRLDRFDFDMSVKIQAKIPIKADPYFSILSLIGSFEGMTIALLILLAIRRKIGGVIAIGTFMFMHVVEIVGKTFLDHPPTPFMFHRYALNVIFPSSYVNPGGSYPSGHAMRAAFVGILFAYLIAKSKFKIEMKYAAWAGIFGYYLILIISRISLGEHWTSDVIGGTLLGTGFALFSLIFI
jgi:membrane-associated phospholipid phosphatase